VASNVLAGRLVAIGDTQLHVVEKGSGFPLLIFHGGPGLDHHMFGDYLDPLADDFRLIFVDQRSQGRSARAPESTWTLGQMAADINSLARALNLGEYATLGHSFGAFVVLQHAVEYPGQAARTIVSGGLPSSRYLSQVQENLAAFEPANLLNQVTASWEREKEARTHDDVASLLRDQLPFQFGDPLDPRIKEYERRTSGARFSPDVLRHFAADETYGGIEVEDRLASVRQPVLVLAGKTDRTCVVEGAQAIAAGIPDARLVVFEHSGHMTFVEENEAFLKAVRGFLPPPG
jgi:proline iminopeptidase